MGVGMVKTEGLLVSAVETFESATALVIRVSQLKQMRVTREGQRVRRELSQQRGRGIGEEDTIMNRLVTG
jgi:hypothetical protein